MSERSEYKPGEFCWVDLASPDRDASIAFYGDLLGWTARDAEVEDADTEGYGFFSLGDKLVAGYGTMPEGGHPAWMSYVNVADADESAKKVEAAGGKVLIGPFDAPGGAGRMAVIQDAEGAFLSLWQPNTHHGAEQVNEVGTWTWNQLVTRDVEKAKGFYGDVFGWSLERAPEAPPDLPFLMWQVEGQRWEEGLAGLMDSPDELPPEVPPHWQVYFAVEEAEKAVEATTSAGGKDYIGVIEIPIGKLGLVDDPQGAAFGVIEPDYPEPR